jgi:hypothetical protein
VEISIGLVMVSVKNEKRSGDNGGLSDREGSRQNDEEGGWEMAGAPALATAEVNNAMALAHRYQSNGPAKPNTSNTPTGVTASYFKDLRTNSLGFSFVRILAYSLQDGPAKSGSA